MTGTTNESTGSEINDLIAKAHETAEKHGWWETPPDFGTLIALCHSELSEALEEYRKGHKMQETYYSPNGQPEGIPTELADTVIRIFDLCGYYGINLEAAISRKMDYNATRPYKHGGKVV